MSGENHDNGHGQHHGARHGGRRGERRANMDWQQFSPTRFYRDPKNGVIRGVCAGIADYFGIPAVPVRIAVVIAFLFFSVPVALAYLILGFVLNPKPDGLYRSEDEERFWRRTRVDPHRTVSEFQQKFRSVEKRIRDAEAYVTSSEFKLNRDFKNL